MLTKAFPVLLALAIAIGVLTELAFTRSKTYTVASALTDAETAIVTVQGQVKPSGENEYILSDETGVVEIQTCPIWYRRIKLDQDERVMVIGEIVKDAARPLKGTMYALAVHKIIRTGKPEIVIRTAPGKPPWMSGVYLRTRSEPNKLSGKK